MKEFKHDGVVTSDHCTVTVLKNGEHVLIPKAHIFGWGEDTILIRGAYAAQKKGDEGMTAKGKPPIGRTACMDAMCHQCEHFNLKGRKDCGRVQCPLYSYMPFREMEPDVSWAALKTKGAVGFVGAKGAEPAEVLTAAERALVFRYGSEVPSEAQKCLSELKQAVEQPVTGGPIDY